MTLPGRLAAALLLALAVPAGAAPVCLDPPYAGASGELGALAERMQRTVAAYPSLATALAEQRPVLCLDDSLIEEQAYFEPKALRIVVRQGLDPDLQLAVTIHEIRHLEQYGRDVCPTIALSLLDYVRTRQALEADAAAIGVYVAWNLRAAGDSGPWDRLGARPSHTDLTARFAAEMAASGDPARATAATYAAWFDNPERREIYTFVSCVNYLDALDREKAQPGHAAIDARFTETLCQLPDGRPYACFLPQ